MCEWLSSAEWCDVQLVCGGRAFGAHRAVLASVSTFLKQIFLSSQDDCSPLFIVLPDFDIEAMFSVLYYVYNGEVFVKYNKMESFLDIIRTLQIFVDEKVLKRTNFLLDSCQQRSKCEIQCSDGKAYVTIRNIHRALSSVKGSPNPVDVKDIQTDCCNQNPAHKYLENLHSPNKDRQRKSCLRDSFIETYPRNCNANGPAAVPAMLSGDYLDPTSVLLLNANDHRSLDEFNGAANTLQSASPALHSPTHERLETFESDSSIRESCNATPDKLIEQKHQQHMAAKDICTPFASRLMSINKDYCSYKTESSNTTLNGSKFNEGKIKTILNAVQKNPWSTEQPICFKPFRRKDVAKLALLNDDNDSNNNIKTQQHIQVKDDAIETNTIFRAEIDKNKDPQIAAEDLAPPNSNCRSNTSTARFACADCGKTFSQLRNYKYHMSVHRGTKEFAATCTVCGKYFNDRGYLSSHMKIHRNRKEYKCPECPKSFNQRVAYNMHVKIHTGIKPHVCDQCGKAFSRKMLLKQHQRTHSGERPYACAHCGKRFADRSNMTLHLRLHTGLKPFSCTLCPKSFTKKHHLKSHLNYHTGAKPYSCPHCKLSFTQSSNMRTHMKKCVPVPGSPGVSGVK